MNDPMIKYKFRGFSVGKLKKLGKNLAFIAVTKASIRASWLYGEH